MDIHLSSSRLLLVLVVFLVVFLTSVCAQSNSRTFTVKENSPEGTLVVNLLKDFNLNINDDEIPILAFSISGGKLQKHLFVSNAELKCNNVPIDREELCQGSKYCKDMMRITLNFPRQHFRYFDIVIEILDENDNEPIFSSPTFNLTIQENVEIGRLFNLPFATDRDTDINDIQSYEIEISDDLDLPFELDVIEQAKSRIKKQIKLRVINTLDRETVPFYQFRIKAVDGGQPDPKHGFLTVNVNVGDVNDNSPVFDKDVYRTTIAEDFQVDDIILVITATDADEGINGDIKYEMVPGQWEEEDMFYLDEFTGELTLIRPLDYSINSNYSIEVMAIDLSQESLSSLAKVEILVEDINNNSPQLHLTPLTADGFAEVQENSKPSTFVLHLFAKDVDSGDNGRVKCSVFDSYPEPNVFELEHISGNEFKLMIVSDNIDREITQSYRLTIRCEDYGVPVLNSTVDVVVKVIDVDDNPPFFEKPLYVVELEENNQLGHSLLQVRADDLDSVINASMKFNLSPESHTEVGDFVSVDENTGMITALQSFDFESQKEHRFNVVVENKCQSCIHLHGSPTSSSTEVLLKILDTNDNKPEFMRKTYKIDIPENSPLSTEVGTLRAVDHDSEPFNLFTFQIQVNDESSFLPFRVDSSSGKIITTASLDREIVPSYNFTVEVVDSNDPRFVSSVGVEITILDLNDNSPTFLSDCKDSQTNLGITETEVVEVCRFVATDPDDGYNGAVTYSLVKEGPHKIFNISSKDGTLFLNTFSFIDAPKKTFVNSTAIFNITILAKDNGRPQLSSILRTTAEINLLPGFSMEALREKRDGYFAGRPLRILALCGVICLCLALIIIPVIVITRRKRKAQAQLLRPRCEIQVKRTMDVPRDSSDEGIDDSADETDNLKSMNDNNSNNNKTHLPNQKFCDVEDKGQALKYDFSDIPDSTLGKKKHKNTDNNQFFSLSRKRKGSTGEKFQDKKDVIYKPSADPPKKQHIFFKPQVSSDEPHHRSGGSERDITSVPSPVFSQSSKVNVNVDIWNGSSLNHVNNPSNDSNRESMSPDNYPYSKVSTFFEYQNHNSKKHVQPNNALVKTDSRNIYY